MTPKERAKGARLMVKRLIREQALSFDARALWLLIESYADANGENAHPSMTTLAKDCQHTLGWVEKYILELRVKGWISSHTMPGGRVNVYHFHTPENQGYIPSKNGVMYTPENQGGRYPRKTGVYRVTLKGSTPYPDKPTSENLVLSPKKKKLPHLPRKRGTAHNPEADAHEEEQPTETREERA